MIKIECWDDRLDNLADKDFVRQTTIGQTHEFYYDQRQKKSYPKRTFYHLKPSGYFQGYANLHMGNVTGCYYNTQSKVTFNDPQDIKNCIWWGESTKQKK